MLTRALVSAALLVLLGFGSTAALPPSPAPSGGSPSTPPEPSTSPSLGSSRSPAASAPSRVLGMSWTFTEVRRPIRPDPPIPTVADAKAWALATLGSGEFYCLDRIVWHESRWNPLVWNHKGSGAYGLVQAKPASKMASAGEDWQTNPITQLRWGIAYAARYGSPCQAWSFWVARGWW